MKTIAGETASEEMALSLYGSSADKQAAKETLATGGDDPTSRELAHPLKEAADTMYPDKPAPTWCETALRSPFTNRREDWRNIVGMALPDVAALETAYAGMLAPTGLEPLTAGKVIFDAVTDAAIAKARGREISDADLQALNEDARAQLREEYGLDDAEDLLARARKFVRAHPALAARLEEGGVGSRPDVVLALAEHVRRNDLR